MRKRSTLLAKILGGAALACLAGGLGMTIVRYDAEAPRLDVLVPLALAAMLVGGWVLAVRAAPPVERIPLPSTHREGIPTTLGAVRRDWGYIAAVYLTIWAPYAAARAAAGTGGSVIGSAWCGITLLFAVAMSLYAIGLLKTQLGAAQRMLMEDAAAGSVHAVRVRFGTAVRQDYRAPAGTGVGDITTTNSYWVDLLPEGDFGGDTGGDTGGDPGGQRVVRLQPMYSGDNFRVMIGDKHLSYAAAQLSGHSGWLCWPRRWKDIAATDKTRGVSAAFVSDTGHVVWGRTGQQDCEHWLRGGAAPVCETGSGPAAEPLPHPSRFLPKAHTRALLIAAAAALTAVPYLLGLVPHALGLALGAAAGILALAASASLTLIGIQRENMDPELWTVSDEAHPSLR